METLKWIKKWFSEQCDGEWEHGYGIQIETLDNPGWSVVIDVENTHMNQKLFERIDIERTETDWIYCRTEDGQEREGAYFVAAGGPENLEEMLMVFKEWVEKSSFLLR